MLKFNEAWWYEVTEGPWLIWKLWRILGIFSFIIIMFLVIMFLINPWFSIIALVALLLGLILLGITRKPWKYLKPVLIVEVCFLVAYWFFPRLVFLAVFAAVAVAILVGLIWVISQVIGHFQWRRRYKKQSTPEFTVFQRR